MNLSHQQIERYGMVGVPMGVVCAMVVLVGLRLSALGAEGPLVEFSRSSGTHIGEVRLSLRRSDGGTGIRYTLDGTEPTASSQEYLSPLNLGETVQVRARAVGQSDGNPIRSETFVRLTDAPGQIQTFASNLPILVLSTWKQAAVGKGRETAAHFSLYEPVVGLARVGGVPTKSSRASIRIPREFEDIPLQFPLLLQLRDEYGKGIEEKLLDMPMASGWLLVPPSGFDPTLIHTSFSMEMGRQVGVPVLKTRQVEVYLNKGGPLTTNQWLGVYLLMEVPSVASSAMEGNVPGEKVDDPVGISGDYLFSTTRLDGPDGELGFVASRNLHRYIEPTEFELKRSERQEQLKYLVSYFAGLDRVLDSSHPKFGDPDLGYKAYLDLTNWIDCHILETLSGNVDAFRLSSYFMKRRAGKLQRGLFWVHERAWESKDDGRDDNPRVWDTGGGLFGSAFWSGIFKDSDAWQLWVDRWFSHRARAFALPNLNGVIDWMTNEVGNVQPRQAKRWPESVPRVSYSNEIRIMKTWISNRVEWIDRQFARSPVIQPLGGEVQPGQLVTLALPSDVSTNGNARIYFTRDGSDPRATGGTNTIVAELYTEPIVISKNTRIVARVVDDGRVQKNTPRTTPWSAPVAATFFVERPRLMITEVMHHPEPPPPFMTHSAEDFQFVELMNPSQKALSLIGFHLGGSIQYRFTAESDRTQLSPGERLVLVRNRQAFSSRYPEVQRVAGEYSGGLDGVARRLWIRGPLEEPVFEATFAPEGDAMVEGVGFSVVPREESFRDQTLVGAGYWRRSSRVGGSPGGGDPVPAPGTQVVLNEVLFGEGGFFELYNPTDTPVDVSGWWLTDDLLVPEKRQIKGGKVVAAHGYLAILLSDLEGGVSSLSYSDSGGEIWLLEASGEGELTGNHDRLRYLSSPLGTARGRRVMPDGSALGFPLPQVTPGFANPPAHTGPIIVAEVQLEPSALARTAGFDDSFIELRNISSREVPLEDPEIHRATLSMNGGIEFHASSGGMIPAGGSLVITAFDPDGDRYSRESFLKLHGRGESIVLLGPWLRRDPSQSDVLLLEWSRRSFLSVDGFESQRVSEMVPMAQIQRSLGVEGMAGVAMTRRRLEGIAEDAGNWALALPTPGGLDSDLDGLGDEWEVNHLMNPHSDVGADGAGGDPDADGFTNAMEAFNGTDPHDSESRFHVVSLPGSGPGELVLVWAGPVGNVYTVEQQASDGLGPWEIRATGSIDTTGRAAVRLAFEPRSAALFRVRLR